MYDLYCISRSSCYKDVLYTLFTTKDCSSICAHVNLKILFYNIYKTLCKETKLVIFFWYAGLGQKF